MRTFVYIPLCINLHLYLAVFVHLLFASCDKSPDILKPIGKVVRRSTEPAGLAMPPLLFIDNFYLYLYFFIRIVVSIVFQKFILDLHSQNIRGIV